MRYLVKAETYDTVTTTESDDLEFIAAMFGEYYNAEIHYDKIEIVDNSTMEILAYFNEGDDKMEFYWTLCNYNVPDIIF